MSYRIVTLVYAIRDDRVLLLCRKKNPFAGYWVAPGGKVESGESPYECAIRELGEETGLRTDDAELRAVITETSNSEDWQWLIFAYRVAEPAGTAASDEREGELRWFRINDELHDARMPEADRIFVPEVLSPDPGVREFRFDYDVDQNLLGEKNLI